MAESFSQKLKNEARAFCIAPIYPFMQRDWPLKMWLFIALSYVPVVNIVMARGWRMDYVKRLGWSNPHVLPNPKDSLKFLRNGLLLTVTRFLFAIPLLILTGNLFKAHRQVRKNFRFLFRNLVDIILMYTFNIFNFIVIFLVDTLLYMSVIGAPLIPIVTFYMSCWNTGYEYGLLAKQMVKQEGLVLENANQLQPANYATL